MTLHRFTRPLGATLLAAAGLTLTGCSQGTSVQQEFFDNTSVATPPIQNGPPCPTDGSTPAVECH